MVFAVIGCQDGLLLFTVRFTILFNSIDCFPLGFCRFACDRLHASGIHISVPCIHRVVVCCCSLACIADRWSSLR